MSSPSISFSLVYMLDSSYASTSHSFRKAVISQLTSLRTRKGLSQTALATELGVDQSIVSRVEAGTRDLGLDEAFAWCEALGLTPDATADLLAQTWEKYAARRKSYWR